ncbi:uncharacterized protein conserved in bacteria [Longilinea arvoryzae]|uniref:Uncharacterized protein conserved in bacteria n=1 Tax=Longilinea arvoryzae TaxID=360412 RepID=A0A0S7BIR3_9CHLR|nr:L,D-transpeptidase [Longilinea arvoryzae]GAP14066.1 uncharacterized protein conserved in bacteria [Longilinea arvoryzae]
MSQPDPSRANLALQQARQALNLGKRTEARRFAMEAARNNPQLEEAWLILAALASPEASLTYLQRALEINPASERAQRGMAWALKRKAESSQPTAPFTVQATTRPISIHPISPASAPASMPVASTPVAPSIQPARERTRPAPAQPVVVKPARRKSTWVWGLLALVLIVCLSVAAWFALPTLTAVANSGAAQRPQGALVKPSLTPTLTPTPTATFTPTITPSPTPTPTETPTPIPTDTPEPQPTQPGAISQLQRPDGVDAGEIWVDVDLTNQRSYLVEDETVIGWFVVSTGTWQHPTVTGLYNIYVKYRYADMSGPGYYLPDVPYVMYFYKGYGLHGTYWHSNFGVPMSHGCVNYRTEDAGFIYERVEVGTPVYVHY